MINKRNIRRSWKTIWLYFTNPGFKAIALYRMANWCYKKGIRFIPGLLTSHAISMTGAHISPSATIGPGFHLPHPVGVVIGGGVAIGSNVWVFNGVVLGQKKRPNEFPNLKDGVHILAGAKVLGRITIGRNAIVGANAVVLKDVPADTTVVGIPAKPISNIE